MNMAYESDKAEWNRLSASMAMHMNMNRPKNKRAVTPEEISPYGKKSASGNGKMSWKLGTKESIQQMKPLATHFR